MNVSATAAMGADLAILLLQELRFISVNELLNSHLKFLHHFIKLGRLSLVMTEFPALMITWLVTQGCQHHATPVKLLHKVLPVGTLNKVCTL